MPKIKLGSPPESFDRTVKFKQLDGAEAEINVKFRYRTREQYAAFMDDLYKVKQAQATPAVGTEITAAAKEGIDRDVDHVAGALLAWDLEDTLDHDSVRLLANQFPAAIAAIVDDYRLAVTEGRAKN